METEISQFEILETLSENKEHQVSVALNKASGEKVVLKKINGFANVNRSGVLFRLRREGEILNKLFSEYVVKLIDIFEANQTIYLVMEYCPGKNLKHTYAQLSFPEKIEVFISAAQALSKVHQKDIVHRDLKPDNILVQKNGETKVKIIDFGLAYVKNLTDVFRQGTVVGTLAYLSPEQTGLLKRTVDNRTDLYALGATFYEVFSGRLPFTEKDPLKLIHAHLSTKPEPPSFINPEIPAVLDQIILKLMAKEPSERYQNAYALKEDLTNLQKNPGTVFELALTDKEYRVNYNGKVIGREKELSHIKDLYQKSRMGEFNTLIIRGKSGAGKSKLLEAFKENLDITEDLLFSYQCSVDTRNIPFRIFKEFFTFFWSQFSYDKWSEKLKEKLGEKLSLIRNLMPDGLLPKEASSSTQEDKIPDKQLFFQIIHDLFEELTKTGQPFIWCLEDFQWADLASLELIGYLSKELKGMPFYLLCTNRMEEQNESYFQENPQFNFLDLKALDVSDLPLLIESVLNQKLDFPEDFYHKVYHDSLGNTLYILEIVKALIQEKVIYWQEGKWKLKEVQFQNYSFDQDMTQLIASRLDKFSDNELDVLTTAAVIGKEFQFDFLRFVLKLEKSPYNLDELFTVLERAKKEQIIEENYYRNTNSYVFVHDKISETLLKKLGKQALERKHELCARVLEDNKEAEDIYQLAYHYNFTRNTSKKIAYNTMAYQNALSQYSLKEAVYYMENICGEYRPVIKFLKKAEINFMIQTANTMQQAGFFDKSKQLVLFLLEQSDKGARKELMTECFLLLGSYYYFKNQLPSALEYYQKAIDESEKSGHEIRYWRPYYLIGNTYFFKSEYSRSVPYFSKALELVPHNDRNSYFLIMGLRLYSYYFLGEISKGDADKEYLENNLEQIDNPITLSSIHHSLALCCNWKGENKRGLEHSLKASDLGEKAGYMVAVYAALFSRIIAYFFMEDFEKVSDTMEKVKEIAEKNKITLIIEVFWSMAAFGELLQKKYGVLQDILNQFFPQLESIENKFAHVVFLYLQAALNYCKNNLEAAKALIRQAHDLAQKRELGITLPWVLLLSQELYEITEDRVGIQKNHEEIKDLAEKMPGLSFMFSHAQKVVHKLKIFREEFISEDQTLSSTSVFKEKLQLENIVKTSQMISSILDTDMLLNSILQSMLETTGAQRGVLKLIAFQKYEESFMFKNLNEEDKDFDFILKILDHSVSERKGKVVSENELKEKGILSAICNPLIIKGNLIGVVYLDSKLIQNLFSEEELKLMNIFTSQAAIAIENARTFEDLKRERNTLDLKVKERTRELSKKNQIIEQRNRQFMDELKLAQIIQQGLIPAKPPQINGIRLSSLYKPMEDVGGDFFDFIKVREPNLLGIFISDVSGHGVPAALITSMVKTLVETAGEHRVKPGSLLSYMNEKLTGQTGGNFLTAFYGIYDSESRLLTYARGAHNAPLLVRGNNISTLESRGKVLGLLDDLEFEEQQIQLKEGDRLIFYTDGLTEAANAQGQEFEEIMPGIIRENESLPASEFLDALYHGLLNHREEFNFEDDVCVVVMDVV